MAQTKTAGSSRFFRIDRFSVPSAGRDELLRRIQETHEILRAQPGYVRDYILEQAATKELLGLLTFVEWDETTDADAVREAVSAMHRQASFDPNELYARLGVELDKGTYYATESLISQGNASSRGAGQTSAHSRAEQAMSTYENDPADELPFDDAPDDASLKRATVRRQYSGGIAGTSLAHVTIYRAADDRVGYVAVDQFEGAVDGRRGGFVFQHGGSIDRGVLRPFGYVVPGSGTGELAGIAGDIKIAFTPPATHTITLTYRFER